jgi:hypothetical protein
MPISKYEDDEVEEIYDIIEETLESLEKVRQTDHNGG